MAFVCKSLPFKNFITKPGNCRLFLISICHLHGIALQKMTKLRYMSVRGGFADLRGNPVCTAANLRARIAAEGQPLYGLLRILQILLSDLLRQ